MGSNAKRSKRHIIKKIIVLRLDEIYDENNALEDVMQPRFKIISLALNSMAWKVRKSIEKTY